ncbi:MAG TPA: FAD-binding oxidoreductase [Casimicrobiaceae bacterium]|nr:FAD-binding oxidoreductase [Casimicrobiaceae bacterium]
MLRIVIIGGGITGAAAAAELVREGHAVTLIEKHGIAAMASGWTLGGVRQSGRDPAELPLARAAVAMWGELAETLGADVEYRRTGNLRLARTPGEVDVIRALVQAQQALGLELHFLSDNAAVRAVAPEISRDVLAASYCPTDGHANPVKATQAFARFAKEHGAAIREGVAALAITVEGDRVTGVDSSGGFIAADRVIVAAGVNTPSLLSPLGANLPLSIRITHVVQSEPMPSCLLPAFGVANADCAGRQEVDGRLRFSSGAGAWPGDPSEWTEGSLAPSVSDIRSVVDRVAQVLPIAAGAPIARAWGGLIDLTPDALPVFDAPEYPSGLVVATGFSGHGFCLGPVSGLLCADLALGRVPRHDLSAFRLARFGQPVTTPAKLTLHG